MKIAYILYFKARNILVVKVIKNYFHMMILNLKQKYKKNIEKRKRNGKTIELKFIHFQRKLKTSKSLWKVKTFKDQKLFLIL